MLCVYLAKGFHVKILNMRLSTNRIINQTILNQIGEFIRFLSNQTKIAINPTPPDIRDPPLLELPQLHQSSQE